MDGYVYEKSAIERWLQKSNRSPLTNEVLASNATVMATRAILPYRGQHSRAVLKHTL